VVVTRRSLALIAVAAATVAVAAPAHATFPGRNGEIFWTEEEPGSSPAEVQLHALNPRTGKDRLVFECHTNPIGAEACNSATSAAASPDGHVALISTADVSASQAGGELVPTLRLFDRFGARRDIDLSPSVVYRSDGEGRRLRFLNDGVTLAAETYAGHFTTPYLHRLLGTDGTLGTQVGPTNALSFDWSIHGRAVFVKNGNLFLLAPDGATRRLTRRGGAAPSWSPHGKRIVFVRKHDLYVMDAKGGPARRLTRRGGDWPTWSPDGRKIAFVRWKPHRTDEFTYEGIPYLFVLDLRSGRAQQVLDRELPFDRYFATPPEWQPLPR
jgi:Dipeptidyl peptidase IV (DPP IV) N-terminal region